MKYETRPDGRILGYAEYEGIPIIFAAKDIRKERNSVKAWVGIRIAGETVAYDEMHPDKDSERVRLSGSAHRQLGEETGRALPQEQIKKALSAFTYGLWEQHMGKIQPKLMNGKRMKEKPWLLRPYLLKKAGVIMFAPPGASKSWTGLGIAITVDHGLADSPYGDPVGRHKALYINLERSDESIQNRIADVNLCLGLEESRPLLTVSERGKTLADVAEQVREIIIKEQVEFVVLDSVSRAGMGDLRADADMNRIMDTLNGFDVAWLAIAHTPRADNTHSFGSIMADAAADLTLGLYFVKDEETGRVVTVLRGGKANDMPTPRARYLAYEFESDHLSCIRLTTASEYIALEAQQQSAILETTVEKIEAILENGPRTPTELSEAIKDVSRQNIDYTLKHHPDRFERLPKQGTRQPWGLKSQTFAQTLAKDQTQTFAQRDAPGSAQRENPLGGFSSPLHTLSPGDSIPECSRCNRSAGEDFEYHETTGEPICSSCSLLEKSA